MKTKWFFFALALAGLANCRVKSDGLDFVTAPGADSHGEPGTGVTLDSGELAGVGGQATGGATASDGMPGSGGTTFPGGATGARDAAVRGGASGTGGRASGGGITVDGATGTGGISNTGGGAGLLLETTDSGDANGTGGASGTGGSPNPDGAIDGPIPPAPDARPNALADARTDVPSDRRKIDGPVGPGDTRGGADAVGAESGAPMTLIWSDEFDGPADTGVDPTKWSYITWDPGQVNGEAQKYTDRLENVFQDGTGNLVIRGLDTPYAGNLYTSGRIESKGLFTFQYGRVEVSAKLPAGIGSFPGIIAMGSTGTWPQCGELALAEQYGQDKSWFYASATASAVSGSGDTGNVKYSFPNATTASSDFHIYSLDWYEDHIVFQVDGNEITRTTFGPSSPFSTIQEYLVLDLALGGTMGGTIDRSAFPMDMIVDYVRVYSF